MNHHDYSNQLHTRKTNFRFCRSLASFATEKNRLSSIIDEKSVEDNQIS